MIYNIIKNNIECSLKELRDKKNTFFYGGILFKVKKLGHMIYNIFIEIEDDEKFDAVWIGELNERDTLVNYLVSIELEKAEAEADAEENEDE